MHIYTVINHPWINGDSLNVRKLVISVYLLRSKCKQTQFLTYRRGTDFGFIQKYFVCFPSPQIAWVHDFADDRSCVVQTTYLYLPFQNQPKFRSRPCLYMSVWCPARVRETVQTWPALDPSYNPIVYHVIRGFLWGPLGNIRESVRGCFCNTGTIDTSARWRCGHVYYSSTSSSTFFLYICSTITGSRRCIRDYFPM